MDLEKDYATEILELNPDYEGEVISVLISSNFNVGNRKSVLYIHGYVDYFFQSHLGKRFNEAGFDFFALDLRKYGRALLEHQHPNYCRDISEYFEEISITIKKIKSRSSSLFLLGHSTGGLMASYYMNQGKEKGLVDGLILNSPFFDFNLSKLEKSLSIFTAKTIAKLSNYAKVNGALSPIYGQSIHKDFYGEWDFNLNWKPIKGFPTYLKWIAAIARAQKSLSNSNIKVPVLVMHSSGSTIPKKYSEEAMTNDIVLNIDDIKRVGQSLGNNVTLMEIDNAIHDIFLSQKPVREEAFSKMFLWLKDRF